jgi:methyl-accepting chemotaxis protein
MTIKNKLVTSSIFATVLFLMIGLTLLVGYRYVATQAYTANAFDNMSKYLQMILRGVNEVILTEGTPQSVDTVASGIKGFEDTKENLFSNTKDSDLLSLHEEKIEPLWKDIRKGIQPFLEHHLDTEDEGLMIQYGKVISRSDELINIVNELSKKERAVVNSHSKTTKKIQYVILAALVAGLVFILSIAYALYTSIISPIKELNNISEGFGKGNLDILMNESRRDEFGTLAEQFNQATGKLSEFISRLKQEIITLSESSEMLSSTSSDIASHTRDQSSQTSTAASAMEELSSSFVNVARNASDAATAAKDATDLAVDGGNVVSETIQGICKIAQSVNATATTIQTLGNSSEQIGEIVKVIDDIASQTNLLALNAAIEAARAGDQGRGFAVVADEVRMLAEKTTSSTHEIGNMIKSIQQEAGKAVEAMHTGTKDVETGVELANQAGESLNQIVTSIQKVTDMILQIAAAAEEQSSTGEEVADNIEAVASIIRKTADNAQITSAYSDQLNLLAADLKKMSEEFTLRNGKNSGAG